MPEKNIIAYVSQIPKSAILSIRDYEEKTGLKFRIMFIMNTARNKDKKTIKDFPGIDIFLEVDFSTPEKIAQAIQPYEHELYAVTSRVESYMADFIKLIPNVPYVRTPTTESLRWASDKLLMRRRMAAYDKKITPKFTEVRENTEEERDRVREKIGFPLIVKPTNLAQSLLVSVCHHEKELEAALKKTFSIIKKTYDENGRTETPRVIIEEFMDGLMYSVDAYVSARGKITFCPLVRTKTGKEVGFDDFFGYLQITPTILSSESVARAQEVASKGIHALALRSTTAHVELMRMDNTWKVIEIGARIGGFRHDLHMITCGIDHSMNDVLTRTGMAPIVPKRCGKYGAAMKWYPKKEGIITKVSGVKGIEKLDSFVRFDGEIKKKGDPINFAKHGGKAVFRLILANEDRSQLLADIRRVEEMVKVEVE